MSGAAMQNDGDRSDLKGGRDGNPQVLVQLRGHRGKSGTKADPAENVLDTLLEKNLIGGPERQAGMKYHAKLRLAASQASIPEYGRIPGQGDPDADACQLEAVLWLEKVNSQLRLREYRMVLSLALHPWSHASLKEIDDQMGYPKNKMHGRLVLCLALRELAVILGYATKGEQRR